MNTADLHPRLRADVEVIAAVNAGLWLVCGALLLLVPSAVVGLLGLAGSAPVAMRGFGAVLVALAAGLALLARRPLGLRLTGALSVADAALALALPVAPFALGVQVGALGWLLFGLLFFVLGSGAAAWFFVRDRLTHAARAVALRTDAPAGSPQAPSPEEPESSSS